MSLVEINQSEYIDKYMKTKILMALLCLCPLFAVAQNYEQQGDELFAEGQYEQAVKKYKAAEVYAEMSGQMVSSQLTQKKEKAQKCAVLLKKATTAEENNQYSEAATAYTELYALHALVSYDKKAKTLNGKSSVAQVSSTQERTTNQNARPKANDKKMLVIPDGVTEIKDREYSGRSYIESVVIPNSVQRIGDDAFIVCSGLTSVTIGDGVISIGNDAFRRCTSLTSVTIGNNVTSIGQSAFWDCSSLTSITIPNSVTSIGLSAFSWCTSLTSITCKAATPPSITDHTWPDHAYKSVSLYVPAESIEAYYHAVGWKKFTKILPIK